MCGGTQHQQRAPTFRYLVGRNLRPSSAVGQWPSQTGRFDMRSLFAFAAFGVPLLSLGSSGTALAAQSKDCGVFMPCAAMKADTAETTTPAVASTRISRRSAALRPAPQATGPVVSG